MSAYQGILGRAQQVASTPYQAYEGQLVAGLDPTQQAGISNINQSYGMAQPYFAQAGQYAQQGAAPVANVSGADIQQYYNPYQQQVIESTMANINESDQRQQQQVKGNAAQAGALGGDRQAVAQAELARQQGLARNQTLAGLQSQGFNTAAGLAQSQQQNQQANAQRAANAAYAYGQLGTGAQGAQLQGAGAQLGAGTVAQQNQQALLNAQYGQFQQQQAFPYQQTGWLAGITAPIAGSMGGTQTTTPPQTSPFSQMLGLGMAGLGAIGRSARGGRIGYADGGTPYGGTSPFAPIDYTRGYIPQMQISPGRGPQFSAPPPGQTQQQQQQGMPSSASIANAYKGGKSLYSMFAGKELGTPGTEGVSGTAGGEAAPLGLDGSYAGAEAPVSSFGDYLSSSVPAAAEGAGESMASLGADAGEGLSTVGAGAGEALGAAGEGLASTAGEWGPAIAESAGEWGPAIAETAGEWGPAVAESFAEWGPMLLAFVKDGGRINGRPPPRKYADGGFVDTVHAIRRGLRSYQDGGDVEMPFNDRWAPVAGGLPEAAPAPMMAFGAPEPAARDFDGGPWEPQRVNPQAMSDWRGGADLAMRDPGNISPAVELPPEITVGASRPAPQMPADAMAFDRGAPSPYRAAQAPEQPSQGGLLGFLDSLRPNMSAETKQGLMAAGLAMAAGQSPNPWTNIGAGGLTGLQAMSSARKEELAKKTSERNADAEARKLMHDLRRDELAERQFNQKQSLEERKLKMPKLTTDERGNPVLIDPLTGQIVGGQNRPISPPVHTPDAPVVAPPPEPPPNAPKAPVTPKPDQVAAKDEDGLPPNAQFVADTSGTVVAPWRQPQILEGMRPADQELVRAIAEGRRQFLPLQRNNRYNQYIMEKVHEYDPQADQTAFARRQRTTNFFAVGTAGGGGQNIAAMNTFGQHAKELNDLADELNMGRFTDWNSLKAGLIQRGFGPKEAQDKIGKWQTASKAVADEGAKVFAGSQSALADREAWHKLFDVSNPKSVTKAKLQEIVKLIDGRLNSLAAQYNDGMRTNHAPPEFIKPRTREIFDAIRGSKAPPGLEGASATGAPAAAPARSAIDQQALDWANANSSDPRAKAIKERLGAP